MKLANLNIRNFHPKCIYLRKISRDKCFNGGNRNRARAIVLKLFKFKLGFPCAGVHTHTPPKMAVLIKSESWYFRNKMSYKPRLNDFLHPNSPFAGVSKRISDLRSCDSTWVPSSAAFFFFFPPILLCRPRTLLRIFTFARIRYTDEGKFSNKRVSENTRKNAKILY